MQFFIKSLLLHKEETDCIIVGVFKSGELTISANNIDQLSNGYISKLVDKGDIDGEIGTTLLLYNIPNITTKRVLLIGCGEKNKFNLKYIPKIIKNSIKILNKRSIQHVIYSLTELNNNNIYWFIRKIVIAIKQQQFNINIFFKKNIYLNTILFNVKDKQCFSSARTALKHSLAIDLGLTAAKHISNLPPNVCNPLYLSLQSEQLSKKYKDNISVTSIDANQMKNLGMHAYLAVGKGSHNKPYMSIIKYSGTNTLNKNNVIILVGKGLTFDSGGISIKPPQKMHEMKYDMCGAAAVYGTLITAAELNLPLNIIGVLAGCENMLSGRAFRPGDVLTTMSGKSVEVLNTDAEGRLVLCDVLTYIERFSPNIVIDIATLTGACVVALGHHFTGLFSNNKDLVKNLKKASKQTDDKVWQLPLFKEYEKDIKSNIADFSNVGHQGAGAITAACFLSQFAKKYNWAHLDIAGTAWKSGANKGSTGRPVELLSQFLLNMSNYTEC